MSDWYGTRSSIPALLAGLDLEMPGPTIFRGPEVLEKVKCGELDPSILNQRADKMLKLVQQTKDVHSKKEETSLVDEASNLLARQVGTEGIVLLQNRKSVLPLQRSRRLAIIGAQATVPSISGGGSAAAPPQYTQRPLDSIRNKCLNPELVQECSGVRIHNVIPIVPTEQIFAQDGSNGVRVRYFNAGSDQPVIDEVQAVPHAVMFGRLREGVNADGFHYEVSTTLVPKTTGLHTIGARTTGSCSVKVNGKEACNSRRFRDLQC